MNDEFDTGGQGCEDAIDNKNGRKEMAGLRGRFNSANMVRISLSDYRF